MQYGNKTFIKRLYFKPDGKFKSISSLWICEIKGSVFKSNDTMKSYYRDKEIETKLEELGSVDNWEELFPISANKKLKQGYY